jgi:hypothetical protein
MPKIEQGDAEQSDAEKDFVSGSDLQFGRRSSIST